MLGNTSPAPLAGFSNVSNATDACAGLNDFGTPHAEIQPPGRKQRLIAHRRARSVGLGPSMWLQFEDRLTIDHQIREVLRAERIVCPVAIQHEIGTYAHLLPDGTQWKATLLIGLPDAHERSRDLPTLNLAAHQLYVQVQGHARVHAQANEDVPDRHLTRPSGVHFLRFQLPDEMRASILRGSSVAMGCAHDQYEYWRTIPGAMLDRLREDLAPVTGHRACAGKSASISIPQSY